MKGSVSNGREEMSGISTSVESTEILLLYVEVPDGATEFGVWKIVYRESSKSESLVVQSVLCMWETSVTRGSWKLTPGLCVMD